jgi:hypothetical protein
MLSLIAASYQPELVNVFQLPCLEILDLSTALLGMPSKSSKFLYIKNSRGPCQKMHTQALQLGASRKENLQLAQQKPI